LFLVLCRLPHAVYVQINTCRTCDHSGNCYAVEIFPNASIAEYGTYSYFTGGFGAVADKIKAEIYARGPVATGVNAEPLLDYAGDVVYDTSFFKMMVNHVVSIVGWDTDPATGQQYWIVRNSWYVVVTRVLEFFQFSPFSLQILFLLCSLVVTDILYFKGENTGETW